MNRAETNSLKMLHTSSGLLVFKSSAGLPAKKTVTEILIPAEVLF